MANIATATFAGGCFWCIDAAFRRVKGIHLVESGYMGGQTDDPTYKDICTGMTGHAEVVQLSFDADVISYSQLLDMFFTLHDPTQLNRQGNDVGTQYRSAVFYHNDAQAELTEQAIKQLQPHLAEKIVTEVTPAVTFYSAEQYHQDYFNENPNQGYCSVVVAPKVVKFSQKYAHLLNE
ncbi:peptide-methionine (S)-S-oxide reductase [Pseudoalteromonas phenolica]|uniref:Peptide methionine sulfoxide reductase MsrA n=2 Tax=Pseudoalteromonas phenolica TaxID=161398 RepID=A0A5S3YVC0_9GAMM|nr:peptide-methionine (S)-S-oxide reductase MsrA [Pseudoalteromonas phenolica]TMP81895.1 peptide-methionine (S)-S-oxide reductase [Pseudoalteromonas phenolica]